MAEVMTSDIELYLQVVLIESQVTFEITSCRVLNHQR